jgi:hypothetical protein
MMQRGTKPIVKEYLIALLLYVTITLVSFWPSFSNITKIIPCNEGDCYYFLWNLWWTNYASFTLHTNIYFTNMIFYPVGSSMVAQSFLPFASWITYPLQLVSIPTAYNFVVLLGFALSGVTAYALVKYLVKDKYAAFIGGLIFAFSPIHTGHLFAGHLDWVSIEFIPLFVLAFLLLVRERKYKYVLVAAISFLFIVFMGGAQQAISSLLFIAALVYFYAFLEGFGKILNTKLFLSILLIVFLVALFGLPLFIQILKGVLGGALQTAKIGSGLLDSVLWSDSLLGFFVPSCYNPTYNSLQSGNSGFLNSFYNAIYRGIVISKINYDERISYIGYLVLFLFLCGIYYDFKKNKSKKTIVWIDLFLLFSLMSLGPLMSFSSNNISDISGPFLIYSIIPILNIIREPGRLYFAATIPLAIITSLGLSELYDGLRVRKPVKKILITSLIGVLIMLDYVGIILPGNSQTLFQNVTIPNAYRIIENNSGNFSVLLLPSRYNADLYQAEQMYYQTLFKKPMLTGYVSRVNDTQHYSFYLTPISQYSYALESNNTFVYLSPVVENMTTITAVVMAKYNVSYVGVMKKAYSQSALQQLIDYSKSIFGNPIYDDNTTSLFSTANIIVESKNTIGYFPTGSWRYWCTPNVGNCAESSNNGWWGLSERNITIFSPSNSTVNINFLAMGLKQTAQSMYLYLNSAKQPFETFTVSPNKTEQHFQLQLSRGFNQLEFSMPSSNSTDNYLTYEIQNFSISKQG